MGRKGRKGADDEIEYEAGPSAAAASTFVEPPRREKKKTRKIKIAVFVPLDAIPGQMVAAIKPNGSEVLVAVPAGIEPGAQFVVMVNEEDDAPPAEEEVAAPPAAAAPAAAPDSEPAAPSEQFVERRNKRGAPALRFQPAPDEAQAMAEALEGDAAASEEDESEDFGRWRRMARATPRPLPLPGMTGVCLAGAYGVSTHADKVVRVWDARTGKRLAAAQHKIELSACCCACGIAAVGDAAGGLHLYDVEGEFIGLRLSPLPPCAGAVRSLAILPLPPPPPADATAAEPAGGDDDGAAAAADELDDLDFGGKKGKGKKGGKKGKKGRKADDDDEADEAEGAAAAAAADPEEAGTAVVVVASYAEGGATVALVRVGGAWPPAQVPRAPLPMPELPAAGGAVGVAAGPAGCVFGATAAGAVAMYDLGAALRAWGPAGGSEWPRVEAAWRSVWRPDACDALADSFADAVSVADAAADDGGSGAPSRRLSYSPSLGLLAAAVDGGAVALWDTRAPGDGGPAAAVAVAGGAGDVHVDESDDGSGGELLVSPSVGGATRLYDVRKVAADRVAVAVGTLPPPPTATAATCFAAEGRTYVVGGGALCPDVWRYSTLRVAPGDDDDEEAAAAAPKKEKKKRQAAAPQKRMFNRTK